MTLSKSQLGTFLSRASGNYKRWVWRKNQVRLAIHQRYGGVGPDFDIDAVMDALSTSEGDMVEKLDRYMAEVRGIT